MTAITETLATWREEITRELAAETAALDPATEALRIAEAAASEADAGWRALGGRITGSLRRGEALAGAVAPRIAEARHMRDAAIGAVAKSRANVENIRYRIVDLQAAVLQLDRALGPAPEPEAAAAALAVPRVIPRPRPVIALDDVIEFPQRPLVTS